MLAHLHKHERVLFYGIAAVPVVTICARLLYRFSYGQRKDGLMIYKSAPKTRSLQAQDQAGLDSTAYPPDALPGARDVDTPYGSIRVYEWGPENGRKVLFLHGISTPCVANAQMATRLVEQQGCRVMLFDLFGRGYSDTPDPIQCKQDIRLFTTQILLALASSSIAWTGQGNSFSLVGYSLGGGIAANFTSYFPTLVNSLVLIAPAGLMRASRISWSSRLIYGGYLPVFLRDTLVRRRIVGSSPPPKTEKVKRIPEKAGDNPEFSPGSTAPLFANSVASAADSVVWQVHSHPGFLPSFISSIQNAPISDQHDRWRLIADRLTAQKAPESSEVEKSLGLEGGKVLLLFGKSDGVVIPEETAADALAVLGEGNVRIELLEGGHDVPITNAQSCVDLLRDFWS